MSDCMNERIGHIEGGRYLEVILNQEFPRTLQEGGEGGVES